MKRIADNAVTAFCLFILVFFAAVGTAGCCLAVADAWTEVTPREPTPAISVYFSPRGGCTQAIVNEIATAKESVRVQAYSFTSAEIGRALIAAKKRGVSVEVILDRGQKRGPLSMSGVLAAAGVKVTFDGKHAIAHNKVIIIDGATVVTGSFNFTANAEKNNAENLMIVRVKQIAEKYVNNWTDHRLHSEAIKP